MSKRLEQNVFSAIVENTPLISIDLIVVNNEGNALLGQRQNRPAQNYWFVPGGRIFKDESFESAFKRITKEELGKEVCLNKSIFMGVYEHFYSDNFTGDDFTTHYVVHGYRLELELLDSDLPRTQHSAYQWFDIQTLLSSNIVHQYTKNYFLSR